MSVSRVKIVSTCALCFALFVGTPSYAIDVVPPPPPVPPTVEPRPDTDLFDVPPNPPKLSAAQPQRLVAGDDICLGGKYVKCADR